MSLKPEEIGTKLVPHILPGMGRALADPHYSINTHRDTLQDRQK